MIGSTLKMMADAEKLSIPQLRQAIKNGTIPSFIGIPMIDERIKAEKLAKQGVPQPKQPPVADRVMAESEAVDRGVEQLPSNLPAQGYALGGIVAFANGGDAEDPYETAYKDYLEAKDLQEDLDIMNAGFDRIDVNATPRSGIAAAPSMSYGQVQGVAPKAARQPQGGLESLPGAKHKYADMALKYAEKYGVDPKLALHVLHKETGGLENPEKARSKAGAIGVMQTMPATAKMLGIKDPTDPEQSIEGGIRYLAQLGKQFKGDPRLTAAAYNAGPGNVRKYGDVPPFRETQGYVQGLKEGGIAHFAAGDPVYDPDIPVRTANWDEVARLGYDDAWERKRKGLPTYLDRVKTPDVATTPATPAAAPAAPAATPVAAPAAVAPAAAQTSESPTQSTTPPTATAETKSEQSAYDKWIERAMAREDRREANANMDRNMGLLAAGLGMLGSQSPYANVGIGQGALAGMSYYQGLQKQRSAEETADLGLMLKAQAYKEAQDIQRERLAQSKELATSSQQNALETKRMGLLQNYEKLYDNKIAQDLKTAYTPEDQARIRAEWEAKKMQDPTWRKLYQEATGLQIPDTLTGGANTGRQRYDARGNLITG